jgi:hypothetical protein
MSRGGLVFGNVERDEAWARTGNAAVGDFGGPFHVGGAGRQRSQEIFVFSCDFDPSGVQGRRVRGQKGSEGGLALAGEAPAPGRDPPGADGRYAAAAVYEGTVAKFLSGISVYSSQTSAWDEGGRAALDSSRLKWAISEADALVALRPNCASAVEKRAALRILGGDYERGMDDLRTAARIDPRDAAVTFEAWPKARLIAGCLRHGEQQIRSMLRDRPVMAKFGDDAKPLYDWAARKFAGEDLGEKVLLSRTSPLSLWEGVRVRAALADKTRRCREQYATRESGMATRPRREAHRWPTRNFVQPCRPTLFARCTTRAAGRPLRRNHRGPRQLRGCATAPD